ncbi:MAG: tRNA guanosine(15) transglycosylase TgtA [Euryarchaeota archaeon]|nr:tRNA guanosine(15) transglycosylase TgtA [Euryarchaeota archaeon]
MTFEIKDRAAGGRIGVFDTPHGKVTTPTLLPVVNPNLRLIAPKDMRRLFGTEMIITNSYILRQSEGLRERALSEGVHKVVDWDGPIMTDSGTFQSYMYGKVAVLPDEIIDFQKRIGVDVGTILDVFTTPDKTKDEASAELDETLVRAAAAAKAKDGMMLAATVQGGVHVDLRERAAKGIAALGVDLAPIGGVVPLMEQGKYATLARIILAAKRNLPSGLPVHLFGAGHPLVFPLAAALGCDLFDSASYAKYAKDDRLMFPWGTRSLTDLTELPCACPACDRWRTAAALRKAPPAERERTLAEHNLHVSFAEIRRIRQAIRDGTLWELVEERAVQNPALLDALRAVSEPSAVDQLERLEPVSANRAFTYKGPHTLHRPLVTRFHRRLLEAYRPQGKVCYVLPERSKPYGEAYGAYLDAFLAQDATFVVDSPLGPVPLELDLTFPVAQSVFPEILDEEARRVRQRFADAFFDKFQGCEILPFDAREYTDLAPEPTDACRDGWDARRLRAIADHQWGHDASDALLAKPLTYVRSPSNCRVRNVMSRGEHVMSLRAEDGLLSLRLAGARRIHAATASPRHRLVVDDDAGPFVASGKNVVARTVQRVDPALRPGDDAIVVTAKDELVGIGRMLLAASEVREVGRGLAAKTTDHVEAGG